MRKGSGVVVRIFLGFFLLCLTASSALAAEAAEDQRIKDLEKRIKKLEDRGQDTEVSSERAHRLHPVHSEFGLEITGGITFTLQGVANVDGLKRTEAAVSGDLAIEGPIGDKGMAVIVLDFQRGLGLDDLNFIAAPNGNPTGTNADVESFNDLGINVTQLYYEHHLLGGGLEVSVGQLDITGYFDANNFANDERSQFMANLFVNNPSIEFGGSDNFYSPGVTLVFSPTDLLDITVGVFEGDGDYSRAFDSPFIMAEADFSLSPLGRDGTYRIYYWRRSSRPDGDIAFLADTTDPALVKAFNQGLGVSLDQYVTEHLGLWLRAGTERGTVSQMKAFIGGGVSATAWFMGREHDTMGLGYGLNFIGRDYKDFMKRTTAGFEPGNEHYVEAYYDLFLGGRGGMGFHLAPDLQYIINRGGMRNTTDAYIYGMRLQADF